MDDIRSNVTRFLDAHNVPYRAYRLPDEKLGALEAAALLNIPAELVYKTIVLTRQDQGKPILALVPGPEEVDLKALARSLGVKKITRPTQRQAESLTGLQAGGISPLALLNRPFQVILDSSAEAHSEIYISGGSRGLNIRLPVTELVRLTGASLARIGRQTD